MPYFFILVVDTGDIMQKIIVVIFCLVTSVCVHAQGLRSFDYYFSHSGVSTDAKEYHARLFDVNASGKTYSILDSAFTENNDTRPFYIYLVCRMLGEAEPELLKEINIVCRYLTEHHPGDVTSVLFAGKNYVDDKYKGMWAHRVGVEMRVTCNNDLLSCLKSSRSMALQNFNGENKNRLEALYNFIRRDLNLFQQH